MKNDNFHNFPTKNIQIYAQNQEISSKKSHEVTNPSRASCTSRGTSRGHEATRYAATLPYTPSISDEIRSKLYRLSDLLSVEIIDDSENNNLKFSLNFLKTIDIVNFNTTFKCSVINDLEDIDHIDYLSVLVTDPPGKPIISVNNGKRLSISNPFIGNNLSLTCLTTIGSPKARYIWFKDNDQVLPSQPNPSLAIPAQTSVNSVAYPIKFWQTDPTGNKLTILSIKNQHDTLSITNLQNSDHGEYKCRAVNGFEDYHSDDTVSDVVHINPINTKMILGALCCVLIGLIPIMILIFKFKNMKKKFNKNIPCDCFTSKSRSNSETSSSLDAQTEAIIREYMTTGAVTFHNFSDRVALDTANIQSGYYGVQNQGLMTVPPTTCIGANQSMYPFQQQVRPSQVELDTMKRQHTQNCSLDSYEPDYSSFPNYQNKVDVPVYGMNRNVDSRIDVDYEDYGSLSGSYETLNVPSVARRLAR